jgi:chemotaxis signal transduction protein
MLGLLIRIGSSRFAIDARNVVEVVPRVDLHPAAPGSPAMAGLLRYRGLVVPVIDLNEHHLQTPCPRQLSTRIILARCGGAARMVGFLAEQVTSTVRIEEPERAAANGGVRQPLLSSEADGLTHLLDLEAVALRALGPVPTSMEVA